MAKQPARKPAQPVVRQNSPRSTAQAESTDFFRNTKLQSWLIFALAFVLYVNTLKHGFVLDDGIVITENMYTQEGLKGIGGILSHDTFYGFFKEASGESLVSGGRYRPMSLVVFAFLFQLVGANAFVFHLFTVLLFGLTCVVLYRTLLKLLTPAFSPLMAEVGYKVAWLAAILFTAHPIHTEVVSNIKCCDEIMALLGSLAALYFALKAWESAQLKWAWAAGASFFAACLSKENAVAYALLIPLALWILLRNRTPDSEETVPRPSIWKLSMPLFIALASFLLLRGAILPWSALLAGEAPKELLNNPFLKFEGGQWVGFSLAEKLATIFYTLWKYLQLLFLPHPLTHDYYPRHVDVMNFGNPFTLLGVAAYGFMAIWAVRGMLRREPLAFGILLFLLPLGIVSNLVFPVGTNMSERFAFMPSVGFALVVAWLLVKYSAQNKGLLLRIFALALLLFAGKTVMRNFAWESNAKLFKTDIAVSANSLKLQTAYSDVLLAQARNETNPEIQRALCQEALQQLDKALKIYPDFKTVYIIRGGVYTVLQKFPEAIADYRKALAQAPNVEQRKNMLAQTLREAGKYYGQQKRDLANAFKHLDEAWLLNPKDPETARLLGVANFVQGKQAEAVEWYVKSEAVSATDAIALWELGVAYANMGNNVKAQELHHRAMELDPKIVQKAMAGEEQNPGR